MTAAPIRPLEIALGSRDLALADLPAPLAPGDLLPGSGPWEVELGFGKGRYLLRRAREEPEARFLGVEMAARYFRIAGDRARARGLENLALIRGEALYILSSVLPSRFARAVHIYFPDPWPKSRHQKRRLLGAETLDLVLELLAPRGRVFVATDHPGYGDRMATVVAGHPGVHARELDDVWPDGPRTNYERKYVAEGRPIRRFVLALADGCGERLHPEGRPGVLAATAPKEEPES